MTTSVASNYVDTGGGGVNNDRSKQAINEKSYADKLKTNVRYDQRLKQNIL